MLIYYPLEWLQSTDKISIKARNYGNYSNYNLLQSFEQEAVVKNLSTKNLPPLKSTSSIDQLLVNSTHISKKDTTIMNGFKFQSSKEELRVVNSTLGS